MMMPWVPTGANGMRGVPYTHTHPQDTHPYTYTQHARTISQAKNNRDTEPSGAERYRYETIWCHFRH